MINKNCFLYVLDNNIVPMMLTSAFSLRKYHSEKIYIFSNRISKENKKVISNELENIEIIEVSKDLENFFPSNEDVDWKIPTTSFAWILLDLYIKEKNVVYLDCDTFIRKKISKLFISNFSETFAAVTENLHTNSYKNWFQYDWMNRLKKTFYDHIKILDMSISEYNNYVNSGVIYINLKKYIKNEYREKFIKWNKENPVRIFNDQDVFNAVAKKDIYFLPAYWNYTKATFGSIGTYKSNQNFFLKSKDAKIIHYAGRKAKPFLPDNDKSYRYSMYYMNIYKKAISACRKNKSKKFLASITLAKLNFYDRTFNEILGVVSTFESFKKVNTNKYDLVLFCPIDDLDESSLALLKSSNIIVKQYKEFIPVEKIKSSARFTSIISSYMQPSLIKNISKYSSITILENDLFFSTPLKISPDKIVVHSGMVKKYIKTTKDEREIIKKNNLSKKGIFSTSQCIASIPGIFYKKFFIEWERIYEELIHDKIINEERPETFYIFFGLIIQIVAKRINVDAMLENEIRYFIHLIHEHNAQDEFNLFKFNFHRNNIFFEKEFSLKPTSKERFEIHAKKNPKHDNEMEYVFMIKFWNDYRKYHSNIIKKALHKNKDDKNLKKELKKFNEVSLKNLKINKKIVKEYLDKKQKMKKIKLRH